MPNQNQTTYVPGLVYVQGQGLQYISGYQPGGSYGVNVGGPSFPVAGSAPERTSNPLTNPGTVGGAQTPQPHQEEQPKPQEQRPPPVPTVRPDITKQAAYNSQEGITRATNVEYVNVEPTTKGYEVSFKSTEQAKAYGGMLETFLKENLGSEYAARVSKVGIGNYLISRTPQEQARLVGWSLAAAYGAPGSTEEQVGQYGLKASGYANPQKASPQEAKTFNDFIQTQVGLNTGELVAIGSAVGGGVLYETKAQFNKPLMQIDYSKAMSVGSYNIPPSKDRGMLYLGEGMRGPPVGNLTQMNPVWVENVLGYHDISRSSERIYNATGVEQTKFLSQVPIIGEAFKGFMYSYFVGFPTLIEQTGQAVIISPITIPKMFANPEQSINFAVEGTGTMIARILTIRGVSGLAGQYFAMGGKLPSDINEVSPIKVERIPDIPGVQRIYTGISFQGRLLFGYTQRGFEVGQPHATIFGVPSEFAGFKPLIPSGFKFPPMEDSTRNLPSYAQTVAETRFFQQSDIQNALHWSDIDRLNQRASIMVGQSLQYVKAPHVEDFIKITKNAGKEPIDIALTTAKPSEPYIYGSFASYAQLPIPLRTLYTSGDIEFMTKDASITAKEVAALTAKGYPAEAEGAGVHLAGGKFLDIHIGESGYYQSGSDMRFGMSDNQPRISIAGYQTQPLGENLVRMTGSTTGYHTTVGPVPLEFNLAKLHPDYLEIAEFITSKGGTITGGETLKVSGFTSIRHPSGTIFDLDIDIPKGDIATKKEVINGINEIIRRQSAGRGGTDVRITAVEPDLFAKEPQKDIVGLSWAGGERSIDIAFNEPIRKTVLVGSVRVIHPTEVLADKLEILAEHTIEGTRIKSEEIGNERIERKVFKAKMDIPVIEELLGRQQQHKIEPLGGEARAKDVVKRYVYGKSLLYYAGYEDELTKTYGVKPTTKLGPVKLEKINTALELLRRPEMYETPKAKELLTELDINIKKLGTAGGIGKFLKENPVTREEIQADIEEMSKTEMKKPTLNYKPIVISSSAIPRTSVTTLNSLYKSIPTASSSVSLSKYVSPSASASISGSIYKSISPSVSPSTSSPSLYKILSPYPSISISPSTSISPSPSISPSISISPSPSVSTSPYISISPSPSISQYPSSPPNTPPLVPPPIGYGGTEQKLLKKLLAGYNVFGKRRGKFLKLNIEPLEKGQAKFLGREWAVETLGATFKIRPAGVMAAETSRQSIEEVGRGFRSYAIRGGKPVYLTDTYIQKRGFRLGSRGEVMEIQSAKALSESMFGRKKKRRR